MKIKQVSKNDQGNEKSTARLRTSESVQNEGREAEEGRIGER